MSVDSGQLLLLLLLLLLVKPRIHPVAPTSLNFKSYLSPDLRTTYGRLYGSKIQT